MRCWVFALVALLAFTADAATMPTLSVRTLAGQTLELPVKLPHAPVLLVIGFSKDSRKQTEAWSRWLDQRQATPGAAVYQVAVIGDIPALIRWAVVSSIRDGVPANLRDRFLLAEKDEMAWRSLTDAPATTDAAFLIVLDANHQVRWRSQGPADSAHRAALQAALSQLDPR